MSKEGRKGYSAEHALEVALKERGFRNVYRPRAGNHEDIGDLAGLPIVISVKNHAKICLSQWLDEANAMGERVDKLAVVWHKRRLHANPEEWYVTMDGATFLSFLSAYTGRPRR